MRRIHLDDWRANPLFPSFWQIEKRECMTTVTVSYVVLRCEISALHRVTVGDLVFDRRGASQSDVIPPLPLALPSTVVNGTLNITRDEPCQQHSHIPMHGPTTSHAVVRTKLSLKQHTAIHHHRSRPRARAYTHTATIISVPVMSAQHDLFWVANACLTNTA